MLLFKTSGTTINSVVANQKHAFYGLPKGWYHGELTLVSKKKHIVERRKNKSNI